MSLNDARVEAGKVHHQNRGVVESGQGLDDGGPLVAVPVRGRGHGQDKVFLLGGRQEAGEHADLLPIVQHPPAGDVSDLGNLCHLHVDHEMV